MKSNRLISVEEVAKYLGISKRTVYRLHEAGQLPAYRIGRLLRFKEGEIEEYLENQRVITPRYLFRSEVLIKYYQDPDHYQIITRGSNGWLRIRGAGVIKYQKRKTEGRSVILVTPRNFDRLSQEQQKEWMKFKMMEITKGV